MDRWSQKFVSCINKWWVNHTVYQRAQRIARDVLPELRESMRRKAGAQNDRVQVANYARSRATHLCYTRVDSLLARNRAISGAAAARIISTSTDRAVELALLETRPFRRICK
jgi:hypothetical protein